MCLIATVAHFTLDAQPKEARLLRFPAASGDKLVFSYAGDLYIVSSRGGTARRLTSDEGYEMFPRFSPDGAQIAFTAQYDGNTEVYRIPVGGGEPVRLTYTATLDRDDVSDRMGPNNIVMTWKDNEHVVYRSRMKSFNDFKGRLYLASVGGGLSEELPFPAGGFCSYSPDGSKLAYNRVFREFRTWKRYRGGMADDVWIHDFKTGVTENITSNPAQDVFPMWSGDLIYFVSDRTGTMNLFGYDTRSRETKQFTSFDEFDVKFPSLGDKAIVFENGGYVWSFDLATRKAERLSIFIGEDATGGRAGLRDASGAVRGADLSPDGKRIALSARGDVYSVPAVSGITRNLTATSGVHERNVRWSPDGSRIAYISDESGEDEIYLRSPDGLQPPVKLTQGGDTYKYAFEWSPDGGKILWSDKMQRLRYIDVDTRSTVEVEHTLDGELRDFAWSPDSRYIAYTLPRFGTTDAVIIYELASGRRETVTDEWFDAGSPSFSDDGRFLAFVSSRTFNPTYSRTEWNHAYSAMDKIYLVPLSRKTPSPFAYENDEAKPVKKDEAAKDSAKPAADRKDGAKKAADKDGADKVGAAAKPDKPNPVEIDFEGIRGRAVELDVAAGGYGRPLVTGDAVYYSRYGGGARGLFMYDLKAKKEVELGDYSIASVTPDRKKFLLSSRGSSYSLVDAPKAKVSVDKTVDLSNVKTVVNLREEWRQIYNECWRQMRDFFYDPGMHGVDWAAVREKYAPLVDHVNDRNDLNYIVGEMIGELNAGHAYVSGGERRAPKRVKTGLLGAELVRDRSGFYRIARILEGRSWSPALRSPLAEPGVDAREGDFITAIDGKPTSGMTDIYAALYDKAERQVELSFNSSPALEGSRRCIVKPVADESALYYFNWVHGNIEKVRRATGGQAGYIHIPDMSVEGLNEFVKYYYPQLDRKALIIDDRGNGGGNVSPMIVERLRREVALLSAPRNGRPGIKPNGTMPGPKVLLIDNYSASDGDLFPYQFRFYGLGKLVGVRTWGGVVGIRGSLPIIDGGTLNRPEFAHTDAEGKSFVIEGHGVEPDVWIDNDPAREYSGEDQQLDRAIELILEELRTNPSRLPDRFPPYPDKSK
jgi:tricorn protease